MPSPEAAQSLGARPAAPPTVTQAEFLKDGNDRAFRQMVHDSLAFAARLEAIRDGFARLIGLTGIQYTILIAVNHRQFEQKVSVSDVAAHLHLSGAFITNETNKLVRLGLLIKEQDPADGRRLVLRTTTEAQDRLTELAEVQSEVNDEHFAPLAEADNFDVFRAIMSDLVDSTDRALALLHGLTPRALASGKIRGLEAASRPPARARKAG